MSVILYLGDNSAIHTQQNGTHVTAHIESMSYWACAYIFFLAITQSLDKSFVLLQTTIKNIQVLVCVDS